MQRILAEAAKIAVFISGEGTNMAALLYASRLKESPFEITLVASNISAAGGLALARREGIETFVHSHKGHSRADHDAAMEEAAIAASADYIVLAGYMRILSDQFVERWAGRILNIHPSLLPKYKGLDTHARALNAGCAVHGCTVHEIVPELDAGHILGQAVVSVMGDDTPSSLAARVLTQEHRLYPATLAAFVADPEAARRQPISIFEQMG